MSMACSTYGEGECKFSVGLIIQTIYNSAVYQLHQFRQFMLCWLHDLILNSQEASMKFKSVLVTKPF
jgi:hypothetical protein